VRKVSALVLQHHAFIHLAHPGHARTLAEEGGDSNGTGLGLTNGDLLSASTSSSQAPGSPGVNNRKSLVGGTTKVLAELQAASTHARNALENTKAQLRWVPGSVCFEEGRR
jgi:hypothetical protein